MKRNRADTREAGKQTSDENVRGHPTADFRSEVCRGKFRRADFLASTDGVYPPAERTGEPESYDRSAVRYFADVAIPTLALAQGVDSSRTLSTVTSCT